jgi:hypothetical protein
LKRGGVKKPTMIRAAVALLIAVVLAGGYLIAAQNAGRESPDREAGFAAFH